MAYYAGYVRIYIGYMQKSTVITSKLVLQCLNGRDNKFEVNLGDRRAQLMFEKIDIPMAQQVQDLENSVGEICGFESTRLEEFTLIIKNEDEKEYD